MCIYNVHGTWCTLRYTEFLLWSFSRVTAVKMCCEADCPCSWLHRVSHSKTKERNKTQRLRKYRTVNSEAQAILNIFLKDYEYPLTLSLPGYSFYLLPPRGESNFLHPMTCIFFFFVTLNHTPTALLGSQLFIHLNKKEVCWLL